MKKIYDKELLEYYIEKNNLSDIFYTDIISFMELHYYEKGEKILQAEETLIYYYFLVDGKIKVSSLLENGKSLLLKFYSEFDSMGDAELMKNIPIFRNVEAVQNSYLIGISADILREKCYDNPKFLRFMVNSLSEKLESTGFNSTYNLLYPLINRLSSYLIEHIAGKDYIVLTSSLADIAQYLGTTYRHLYRTFRTLEEKKIIRCDGETIYVLNKKELRILSKNLYK